jgi:hypothetical protein
MYDRLFQIGIVGFLGGCSLTLPVHGTSVTGLRELL